MSSHRLQVLIPPELDAQIEQAARRSHVSKGEWVRRALRQSLGEPDPRKRAMEAVARLSRMNLPTCDIEQMIAETEQGRFGELP
ncbi:MAG TPA: CopG family transcriptional regulator [Bryobacteraceae bacterium]|jgi:metal-responsive CopG/Arc/MetJ family transcriptional regulator|nr:CopG family transcriptional regulator [Bryobacteraceae bacterium]